ncbi:MAG: CehA/McbA family metallohydrolase, partial [Planctomycetota bacterium]|nr:CehA/McbA family metallohydrolase [Planctomycetota bacterium]
NNEWVLSLNGTDFATLQTGDALGERHYVIPAGLLRAGTNSLALTGKTPTDDITFGKVRILAGSLREVLQLRPLTVFVQEAGSGAPLPARISIAAEDGTRPAVWYGARDLTAVRDGVVYTAEGGASFELPEGTYDIYASRGFEWGLARKRVVVGAGEGAPVVLELAREVDTANYVACDTHIHTYTLSGHGDSTVEERMVTLAAEGVELPIATDHNHNTDYRPYQAKLELNRYFTPVVGNEVNFSGLPGHFNVFPLNPDDPIPSREADNWDQIMENLRARSPRVVILNHPRWPARDTGPFGKFKLEHETGARQSGPERFTFDAMELVNSCTEEEDALYLYRDWFALLNRGEGVLGVGSSDSHTVGLPVGQGRTYVRSSATDPARIDVDEACTNMLAGRMSVSLGIMVDVRVDESAGMGATLVPQGTEMDVEVTVKAPSWVRPRTVQLFLNGVQVAQMDLPEPQGATAIRPRFTLPKPRFDAHLVVVVLGDPVNSPHWPDINNYTLASTNPVWIDSDGDGYRSPRETARALLGQFGGNGMDLARLIGPVDSAIAAQLRDLTAPPAAPPAAPEPQEE